jgi:hypothetical protein
MFIEFSQRPGGVVWITFGEKLTQHQACGQIYQFEKRKKIFNPYDMNENLQLM